MFTPVPTYSAPAFAPTTTRGRSVKITDLQLYPFKINQNAYICGAGLSGYDAKRFAE
jgi:hypothetical protein